MTQEKLDLHLFDAAVQTTLLNAQGNDLAPEIKTYYDKLLIANAEPELVHDQFAQKRNIPGGNGKTIEFRRFTQLKKQLTPLVEGVTPAGNKLDVTAMVAQVSQFGDYIVASDMLDLTAIDDIGTETTTLLGSQAGRTLDSVTRDVLCGGTRVMYAPAVIDGEETEVLDREEITKDCKLTVDMIYRAARALKAMNAPKINGDYVGIINQDTAYDLMRSTEWIDSHKYADVQPLFTGEIGKIGGVRFVESTEAKIIGPDPICGLLPSRTTVHTAVSASADVLINETITAEDAAAINAAVTAGAQYQVYVAGQARTVQSVTAGAPGTAKITVDSQITSAAKGALVCGGGAGADGSAVYCVIILGQNAYGTTNIEGGGLEHIFKPLGSGGTSDALNQRWSMGWKATKVAERLVEDYIVRIECGSTFSPSALSN